MVTGQLHAAHVYTHAPQRPSIVKRTPNSRELQAMAKAALSPTPKVQGLHSTKALHTCMRPLFTLPHSVLLLAKPSPPAPPHTHIPQSSTTHRHLHPLSTHHQKQQPRPNHTQPKASHNTRLKAAAPTPSYKLKPQVTLQEGTLYNRTEATADISLRMLPTATFTQTLSTWARAPPSPPNTHILTSSL